MGEGVNQAAPAERSRTAIVAADDTRFEACIVAPPGGGADPRPPCPPRAASGGGAPGINRMSQTVSGGLSAYRG